MSIKLYKLNASPPARAAMMACDIFNVPNVEMLDVKFFEGEHHSPEYLKKNPLHTVPLMDFGDLILHDSHTILTYLADTYGKDDSWYPNDTKKRALVDQKLFLNASVLFSRLRNITFNAIVKGEKHVPQNKLDDVDEAYGFLEQFLSSTKYLAGDHMTIADIAAYTTVSSLTILLPLDSAKYSKLQSWLKEMDHQPFATKYNEPGIKQLKELVAQYTDLTRNMFNQEYLSRLK